MGGSKGAPATPDFNGLADKQINANRYNDNGPFASTSWTRPSGSGAPSAGAAGADRSFARAVASGAGNGSGTSGGSGGADGPWTRTTNLDPSLSGAADSLKSQFAANAGKPPMTGNDARDQAITATYNQLSSRLDPQFAQREEAMRSQLLNQGLDPGSEAYDTAAGNLGRERNDAYQTAANAAIQNGNQAQALTFGENLTARELPLQEMGAVRGLASPTGGPAAQADYLGPASAAYSGALQQYGINQQSKNSKMGGAASLGAAGIAASDERLKTNIERGLLEALPGVPFASWEWKDAPGKRAFGVIAQDLEKVRPDLVSRRADGMRLVDYGALFGAR